MEEDKSKILTIFVSLSKDGFKESVFEMSYKETSRHCVATNGEVTKNVENGSLMKPFGRGNEPYTVEMWTKCFPYQKDMAISVLKEKISERVLHIEAVVKSLSVHVSKNHTTI